MGRESRVGSCSQVMGDVFFTCVLTRYGSPHLVYMIKTVVHIESVSNYDLNNKKASFSKYF